MRTETPRAAIRPEPDKGEGEGSVRIVGEVTGLAPGGQPGAEAPPPPPHTWVVGPTLHSAHPREGRGPMRIQEALTLQEAVEEAGTPVKGREAGEPGGEGREGEHGSLGLGLRWDRPNDITGQRCL